MNPPAVIATAPQASQAPPSTTLAAAARALGASGGGAGSARLVALLYNPDVDVAEVLSCLHGEPALAARVLKVANAPYYRLSGSVGTLERALQVLGLTAVRGVAAAGCLDRLAPPRAGTAFDPVRFRRHSLAVACAAQELSRAAGCGVDSEAFMAGLLHDIGLMLLVQAAPAAMVSFTPPEDTSAAAAVAAERAHFGATHEEAAAVLVQTWALPAWLQDAVVAHHLPAAPAPAPTPAPLRGMLALPTLLALADQAAHAAGMGLWPLCGQHDAPALLPTLGLAPAAFEATVQALPELVARQTQDR